MRYLLDEDLNPAVANAGRGRGLEVESVHHIGRRGYGDADQLAFAAAGEYVFITRNRDDFIRLTVAWYQTGRPHFGVLIVPRSLPNDRPARIAEALRRWDDGWGKAGNQSTAYLVDFLAS